MPYYTLKAVGDVTTASTNVVINPIDISIFDQFAITYKNQISSCMTINVEVATAPLGTASVLDFYQLPTATIPSPSGLAASGIVITSAINNCWNWLRIKCHSSATAAATQKLTVAITGKRN